MGDTNIMSDLQKCASILTINQEKTKYMFITSNVWYDEDELDLEVDEIFVQQVHVFK